MKQLLLTLISLYVIVVATSCEGYRCGKGKVVDKVTNLPIDSVLCEVMTGNLAVYTDTAGNFKICNAMGGCVPKCKDIIIRFSKAGYKAISIENPDSTIVYLER